MFSSLKDIFTPPFKLSGFSEFSRHSEGFKAIYKTKKITDETDKQEVYIYSKIYFDNIVKSYENYIVNDKPITETSFKLYVEIQRDDELDYKHIYSMSYDNLYKKKIAWENKYDDNFSIEGTFRIKIEVMGYVIYDYDSDGYDYVKPYKKAISETECIICLEKTPNVFYSECLHMCVCSSCDTTGEFTKCPLCRTKIKNNKIKF